MNHVPIARAVRTRWPVAVISLAAALAAAAITSRLTVPVYSATAIVRVAQAQSGTVQYGDFLYADRLINTYARMALSSSVLDQVIAQLHLATTSDRLAHQLQIKPVADTELITVSAENTDPDQAVQVASALAQILSQSSSQQLYSGGAKSAVDIVGDQVQAVSKELADKRALVLASSADPATAGGLQQEVSALEQSYASLLRQYDDVRATEALRANSVSIVEPAKRPEAASRPNWPINLSVAALLGLLLGSGLGYALEDMDRKVRDVRSLSRNLAVPLLGVVPWLSGRGGSDSLPTLRPTPPTWAVAEAYRFLQLSLTALPAGAVHSLVVTSAEPGEGKSTVAANLAIALAQAGTRVMLVDADFHRPTINQLFALPNVRGFGDVVAGHAEPSDVVSTTSVPNLSVLTSGALPWRPGGVLGSAQMASALDKLAALADVVVFDTPPVLAVADATQLVSLVDQTILVVGEGRVSRARVAEAVDHLRTIKGNPLGMIGLLRVSATRNPYAQYAASVTPFPTANAQPDVEPRQGLA